MVKYFYQLVKIFYLRENPSMTKDKILVVDDDPSVIETLEIMLKNEGKEVAGITNPNVILQSLESGDFDVILLDMNFEAGVMSGNEGFFWLNEIRKKDPDALVIMITAYGDYELVVRAMKEGASDFVVKPWENEKLISTINSACRLRRTRKELIRVNRKNHQLNKEINRPVDELIGSSPPIKELKETIAKVAPTDVNVLILGENGTGKELVARKIHSLSGRGMQVFIHVDLGSLNENLFESELFGHKKGAFTDAYQDKTGRFEIASGGTLFLDEIGNIPLMLQPKLLGVLEKREVNPVGSSKPYSFDIRLISATNKDLLLEIGSGSFREDLFYRLNTVMINVPPLRERGDDIIQLAEYFLKRFTQKYNKAPMQFENSTYDKLINYKWLGNVRELMHAVEKAVILNSGNVLTETDFILETYRKGVSNKDWPLTFKEIEKQAILRALVNNKQSIVGAARELGLTRQTLFNKCKKYDIKY